jgi:hypothetical protein
MRRSHCRFQIFLFLHAWIISDNNIPSGSSSNRCHPNPFQVVVTTDRKATVSVVSLKKTKDKEEFVDGNTRS